VTVNTVFDNWQTCGLNWDAAPYEQASPNLLALLEHLRATWGGISLGIEGDRPIRAGQSPSSHSYGAALDWRWQAPAAGAPGRWISRAQLDAEVLPWLIDNSHELGVQAIHDAGRIWRSARPVPGRAGWSPYKTGYTGWLHIETTIGAWSNPTPIPARLAPAPPALGPCGVWPLGVKPRIVLGSSGGVVRYLQGVISAKAGGNIAVDGLFGAQTERRVRDLQRFFGLTVDGVVGSQTWRIVDRLATA
jgi:hypothetical protein